MNYKKHVEDLKNKCDAFLRQVSEIGNECAWTDRTVENILTSAKSLRQAYYGKEDVSHGTVSVEAQIRAAEAAKGPIAVSADGREYKNTERG